MGRRGIDIEFASLSELGDTPLLAGVAAPADAAVSRSQPQPNEAADQSGLARTAPTIIPSGFRLSRRRYDPE